MSLPQNVIQELQRWLSDVSNLWQGPGGETGIDIGMHGQIDTPVYAVTSGKVIGSGYYGGGGVESIASNINYGGINGIASIYYQHLDQNLVSVGQNVYAGELIGLSGGQLSGGSHPSSSQFSNGPHIEIGINAPYGKAYQSIWSPLGPNVNPLDFFKSLLNNNTSVLGTGSGGTIGSTIQGAIQGAASSLPTPNNIMDAIQNVAQSLQNLPQNIVSGITGNIVNTVKSQTGISSLSDLGWRTVLIFIGFIIMFAAILFVAIDLLDKSNVEVAGTRV